MSASTTSTSRWFVRGVAGGILAFAALNAVSWFWLSDCWSDLCGATRNSATEAVGFPFEIWREGKHYESMWMMDFPKFALNLVIAFCASTFLGFLVAFSSQSLSKRFDALELENETRTKRNLTFSVRGLLFAMTLVAGVLGAIRLLGVSPWLLGAIYFVGPLVLILIAMAPVGLPWQQRVVILVGFAGLLLSGSVFVGYRLGMEFDRVLMGIFICWVPQSVFATALVIIWSYFVSSPHREPQALAAKA